MGLSYVAILALASAVFAAPPGIRKPVKNITTRTSSSVKAALTSTAASTTIYSITTATSSPSVASVSSYMPYWESDTEFESDDEDEDENENEEVAPTTKKSVRNATTLTSAPASIITTPATVPDDSTVVTCWGTDWQTKSDMTVGVFTGTYHTTVPITDAAHRCFYTYVGPKPSSTPAASVSSATPAFVDPMMTSTARLSVKRPSSRLPMTTAFAEEGPSHDDSEDESDFEDEDEFETSTLDSVVTHVQPIPIFANHTSVKTVFRTQTVVSASPTTRVIGTAIPVPEQRYSVKNHTQTKFATHTTTRWSNHTTTLVQAKPTTKSLFVTKTLLNNYTTTLYQVKPKTASLIVTKTLLNNHTTTLVQVKPTTESRVLTTTLLDPAFTKTILTTYTLPEFYPVTVTTTKFIVVTETLETVTPRYIFSRTTEIKEVPTTVVQTSVSTLTIEVEAKPTPGPGYQRKKTFRPQRKAVQVEPVDFALETCIESCFKRGGHWGGCYAKCF